MERHKNADEGQTGSLCSPESCKSKTVSFCVGCSSKATQNSATSCGGGRHKTWSHFAETIFPLVALCVASHRHSTDPPYINPKMADSASDEDDVPLQRLKKKKTTSSTKKKKPQQSSPTQLRRLRLRRPPRSANNSPTDGSSSAKKKVKTEDMTRSQRLEKLEKAERLQYAMQSFLWWDAHDPPPGCQWVTMEHNGVSFPEPYVPHGVKMLYDGQEVDLTPVQEEAYVSKLTRVGRHCSGCKIYCGMRGIGTLLRWHSLVCHSLPS